MNTSLPKAFASVAFILVFMASSTEAYALNIHSLLQAKQFVDSKYFGASAIDAVTTAPLEAPTVQVTNPSVTPTATTSASSTLTIDLTKGSKGKDVLALQQYLKAKGYLIVAPNGYFGENTRIAVRRLQLVNKLPTSGMVGPRTRALINNGSVSFTGTNNTGIIIVTTIENDQCVFTSYPVSWNPGTVPDVIGAQKVIDTKPMINNDCKNNYEAVTNSTTGEISIITKVKNN